MGIDKKAPCLLPGTINQTIVLVWHAPHVWPASVGHATLQPHNRS